MHHALKCNKVITWKTFVDMLIENILSALNAGNKSVKSALEKMETAAKNLEHQAFAAQVEKDSERHAEVMATMTQYGMELKTLLGSKKPDRDISAPGSSPTFPCHVIPYLRNDRFTGRKETLQEMMSFLDPGQVLQLPRILTLCGIGGVGKTQAALEFIYSRKSSYEVILWAAADTPAKLGKAYLNFSSALGLGNDDGTESMDRSRESVKKWLSAASKYNATCKFR